MTTNTQNAFRCIQIAVVAVLVGQAWLHFSIGAPYRALLWDEGWMKPIVQFWGWNWSDYVQSELVDKAINRAIKGIGIFFILCALIALFVKYLSKWIVGILWVSVLILLLLAFLHFKERFFHVGQLFEYTLQFMCPLFLMWLQPLKIPSSRLSLGIKLAIALTFISHGLYAIHFYPRPGNFVEMTMAILHTTETQAAWFLTIVGWLDIFAGVLLLTPTRMAQMALYYLIFWGFVTSIARLWTYVQFDFLEETLMRWLPEVLVRSPHFLVPLAFLLYHKAHSVIAEE